jgi:leucyl aminopeptidase (aminopeptidase T)
MDHEKQIQAFNVLFEKCLLINDSDELLVICDESMRPFYDALEAAVKARSLSATFIFLSKKYQQFLIQHSTSSGSHDKVDLPSGVVAAITASTAMLNTLDSVAYNASIRKAVNHIPRPSNCRLATIPGISEQVLTAIFEADTAQILASCEQVAWLLGEADKTEVITYDSAGSSYSLTLELNGWDIEPIMSPGVFLPGSWGNVPPGETFCCPPPESVNGQVCISGSFRGHILQAPEEVVLDFSKGKLTSWRPATKIGDVRAATFFFDQLRSTSESAGDLNWNTFAELGIGLNPSIKNLTGNALFDEKAANTIHVAIGDNSVFGDDISSLIHEDLVAWYPSLRVNGTEVMSRGTICQDVVRDLRRDNIEAIPVMSLTGATMYLREARIGYHNGKLMRRLSKAQRINYVEIVSNPQFAEGLRALYEKLKTYSVINVAGFINSNSEFNGIASSRLLDILYHYRVLGMSEPARNKAE